jgi:hypothetical protein
MILGLLRGTSGRRRRVTTAHLFEGELLNGLPLAWHCVAGHRWKILWRALSSYRGFPKIGRGQLGFNGYSGTNLVLPPTPTFILCGTKLMSGFILCGTKLASVSVRYGTKLASVSVSYSTNLVLLNISVNCVNSPHDFIRDLRELHIRTSSLIA